MPMNTCMRCLYCGKQLALFRRLTGGGEFCSEAHKHSYHEEYNKLALSRLLQAHNESDGRAEPVLAGNENVGQADAEANEDRVLTLPCVPR